MKPAIVFALAIAVAGCASRTGTPAKPAARAAAPRAQAATPAAPAQTPARPASGDAADASSGDDESGARAERREAPALRPYDRVITREAKSDAGVFTVHRLRDRVYYEIPKAMLGREFL